ncbi:hypothetical protein HYR99_36905 [Candidatus Poribacteria bacterium]|nr:hypothetical protein [Candidatus Poribacteria bacterium]
MVRKRISPDELPELVRALDYGTSEEQSHALRVLCPCRSQVCDSEVWLKIFRATESDAPEVRNDANHAIATLKDIAVRDLRAWQLILQWQEDLKLKVEVKPPTGKLLSAQFSKARKGPYKMLGFQRQMVINAVLREMLKPTAQLIGLC